MNWLWRLIFFVIGQRAKLRLLREAKRQGVIAYLRLLQGTRRVLVVALAAFLIVQLMLISFVGTVVCAVWLWDTDLQLKLQVLCGIFATLFTLPFIGLLVLFNERLWYQASGAQKMVENIQRKSG